MSSVAPFVVFYAGAVLLAVAPAPLRRLLALLVPVVGALNLYGLPDGTGAAFELFDYTLVLVEMDRLSSLFGYLFHLAAFLGFIYAFDVRDRMQQVSAMLYAGSALGAVFAGDLLTLFVFWEMLALTSVFLVLARRTERSFGAAMRYLVIQVTSGVLLLAGALAIIADTGDARFTRMTLDGLGPWLIFLAIGIKCCFPGLHNWLTDAYPESTPAGTVFLSAFTTKVAVYALARGFPGTELLVYIGATMAMFPIFFAVIENDLRKVLAFSTNNQIGFMVCAVGVGTPLAINGAVAHAFTHIFFKGLLFMSMGAVMYRAGTTKASELGGIYRTMPLTALFCLIGAASISAFPLFSGFIAKSMTMSAVGQGGYVLVWCMLLFASAGVLEHSGIKIPYFAFFSHDSGKRPQEAPFSMLLAMGGAAFICIATGIPGLGGTEWLYSILPYSDEALDYLAHDMWTADHVLTQLQLLILAMFAFIVLKRIGVYPPEKPGVILDTDWLIRRPGYGLVSWADAVWARLGPAMDRIRARIASSVFDQLTFAFSPAGMLSRSGLASATSIWSAVILGLVLAVSILSAL